MAVFGMATLQQNLIFQREFSSCRACPHALCFGSLPFMLSKPKRIRAAFQRPANPFGLPSSPGRAALLRRLIFGKL
jgi:hypothetical protein